MGKVLKNLFKIKKEADIVEGREVELSNLDLFKIYGKAMKNTSDNESFSLNTEGGSVKV